MEGREGVSSSSGEVPVVGSHAPSDYHVAPRSDNPIQTTEPSPTLAAAPSQVVLAEPAAGAIVLLKKKRGRPRKYAPDGSLNLPLSPKPISSSVIDFSAQKRGKVRPVGAVSRPKFEVENIGEWIPCSSGTNFTPHIITVNIGEDVTMKVISFLQQGPRAICILSANGAISSVTLRQPDSSGGTLTYEGRFEILSLSGSFMPSETRGTRSRSGGMSVSLASPDGRVVGGGVAGLLVAATPVQVIVGSFLSGNQHEEGPKKPKNDVISTASPIAVVPVSTSSPSYVGGDNWPSLATSKSTDINVSFFNGEDDT